MEVCITEKEFDVIVKESGKSDVKLDANIEVFNYLTHHHDMLLSALDELNKSNSDYFNNAVAYLSYFAKVFNIKYLYNEIEIPIPNDLKNASFTNLPTEKKIKEYSNKLKKVVSLSKKTIYEIDDISDVPLVCILHYSKYGFAVRRCKNCKKWFIPRTTKDTKFCYRNDEVYTSMQCNLAYKYKLQQKKAKDDEMYILHKQIYNKLRNKVVRTKDIEKQKDAEIKLNQFKIDNNKKIELFNQNKITKDDYIKWLNAYK